jgi:hypothetical protein
MLLLHSAMRPPFPLHDVLHLFPNAFPIGQHRGMWERLLGNTDPSSGTHGRHARIVVRIAVGVTLCDPLYHPVSHRYRHMISKSTLRCETFFGELLVVTLLPAKLSQALVAMRYRGRKKLPGWISSLPTPSLGSGWGSRGLCRAIGQQCCSWDCWQPMTCSLKTAGVYDDGRRCLS